MADYTVLVVTMVGLFLGIACSTNKTNIHVGVICTMSNHWWIHAKVFPSIIQAAFDDVDSTTSILPGYRLVLNVADDQGLPGLAMKGFFGFLHTQPPIHMLLGPTKSEATYAVSRVASVWNLMSVLYSARSSDITDRTKYKNTFVLNPIDNSLNALRLALMEHFGWSKVATVTQDITAFSRQMDSFHEMLKENNMTLLASVLLTENTNDYIAQKMHRLKDVDARIIIANINDMSVRQVFCEAKRIGLTGGNYVWILINWSLSTGWPSISKLDTVWGDDLVQSRCTTQELVDASQGYIGMGSKIISDSPLPTVSGRTALEEANRMRAMFSDVTEDGKLPNNFPNAIDAAWTVALALNASVAKLAKIGKRLEEFTYTDTEIAEVMRASLEEVNFDGVTGPISFRKDGSRLGLSYITQWRGITLHEVGKYVEVHNRLEWYTSNTIHWSGGVVVRDSFIRRYEHFSLPSGLKWTMLALAIVGVTLSFTLLTFNVYNRNKRYIKMSSPNLNNLIISGAVMMYVMVIISSMDRSMISLDAYQAICMVKPWVIGVAFTLAFGSMFSKTWRIHRIFINEKQKRRIITDNKLFGMVGVLLLCDLVILILWTSLHPFTATELKLTHRASIEGRDVIVVPVQTVCESPKSIWYQSTMYIYKGLLLVLGSFLAFETKHVSYPSLNDSKSIGICVYNVAILCAFAVPLSHVLNQEQQDIEFGLIASLVIFCTTSTLILLFFNKIVMRNTQVDTMRLDLSTTCSVNNHNSSAAYPSVNTGASTLRMSVLKTNNNSS